MTASEIAIPLPLLRLTSSLLPVGAFAYSRGLEYAAHAGWVKDSAQLTDWLFATLRQSFSTLDGAVFLRMSAALQTGNIEEFQRLDNLLAAARESYEMLMEDRRMAETMISLLHDLDVSSVTAQGLSCQTFTGAYALAVHDMEIAAESGLHGLLWSVCEAQVAAAIRLGLIGQTEGQRILSDAPGIIVECGQIARDTRDDAIGNMSFMMAVGSALHETQYSRLFRS